MGLFDNIRSTIQTAGRVAAAVKEWNDDRNEPVPAAKVAPQPVAQAVEEAPVDAAEAAPAPAPAPEETVLGDPEVAVQVFGRVSCPWTRRCLHLLHDRGIEHLHIDLDSDDGRAAVRHLVSQTKQHTQPYVYVRGEFIGGYNALDELDRLGQLEEAVKTAEERAKDVRPGRTRIVMAKRGEDEAPIGASTMPRDR